MQRIHISYRHVGFQHADCHNHSGPGRQKEYEMKKLAAVLFTAIAMAPVPVVIAPVANADICAGASGRHFAAGGCTPGVAGDAAAGAAIAAADHPYWDGQEPCYTVEGVPYYTPDGDPC
jgi:hypothetical protein